MTSKKKKSLFNLLLSGNSYNTWAVPWPLNVVFSEMNVDNSKSRVLKLVTSESEILEHSIQTTQLHYFKCKV